MLHLIARIFEPFLRVVWPAAGRHRSAGRLHLNPSSPLDVPTSRLPRVPLPRGEDSALVRPYLVAYEQHASHEARRQRARRRALWLAVHGIDIGPRLIHGVEVTA
ncbi:hypothetical protein ACIBBB_10650 [Streptomyces sp. NPDC051217]|uniref:hypothetical protein n=1 Tax=Streptomyces sp. NPDC051217 TaxID=3365644 RepID=UPI0037A3EFD4